MATIDDVISLGERLRQLREDAATQGLELGELIGHGGYGVVFGLSGPRFGANVVKLPLIWPDFDDEHPDVVSRGHGPNRITQVSPTGPFVARGARSEEEARELLEAACDRQTARPCAVLPRLIGRVELAGTPAAIFERLGGLPLRRHGPVWTRSFEGFCRHLSEALLILHRDFGPHGDLKPEHILCTGLDFEVRLIDPLPITDRWIGSVGYTLGRALSFGLTEGVSAEELARAQDVGALVPTLAELFGRDVGWGGRVLYVVANRFNGRFGQGFDPKRLVESLDRAIGDVPEPLRAWLARVGRDVIGLYAGSPLHPAETTLAEGWSEARLRELGAMSFG